MEMNSAREKYDIAKSLLQLMIGHYSELIRAEEKLNNYNQEKVTAWEQAQDALSETDSMLSVEDEDQIEDVISSYGEFVNNFMKRQ